MKNRITRIVLAVTVVFTVSAHADISGRIVRILDGDTVETLQDNGELTRVRLAGIDAPEKAQPFGQRARQAVSDRIAQQHVLITGNERDRYGRLLGTVWLGNDDVNADQVQAGMAWAYRFHGKVLSAQYAALEQSAREQKTGLWADPAPVEPWRWRQSQKSEE